ncbi:hypothetical protein M8J76_014656 [Diaphorina citri]|nr:hypothetical protein M8J76_014656 [Diaphorina citri]
MTKRIRGTDEERKLLYELIIKYQEKVESKKTDTVSNLEKKEAWLKIAREYNAQGDHEELFSKSVAEGVRVYRTVDPERFKGSEMTEKFTRDLTSSTQNLFEALNHL